MATTTNFGWETPDDTDLVKDGALAMRTLGNAIDTSLVDLKGGTTGQVLSKTSNTDMDFTWVTSDDANAIQNAIVDAKGDLITATAADTPARLAVGSNGDTLVADSSSSTGLRWQGNYSAGKQKIINGKFDIWQRGTSFTADGYTADRFALRLSGATATVSRQSFTVGQTDVPENPTYFLRLAVTTGDNSCRIETLLEDVINSSGKTFTVSFWAKGTNPAGGNLEVIGRQEFGSGGSTAVTVSAGTITLTGSWQRFTKTFTFASVSGKTLVANNSYGIDIRQPQGDTGTAAWTLDIANIQLEEGNVATAFQTATGTLQGELALAQRYYYRTSQTSNGWPVTQAGYATSTTVLRAATKFPVTMRIAPTALEQNGTASDYRVSGGGGAATTCSAVPSFVFGHPDFGVTAFTVAAGLVAYNAGWGGNNSSTNADSYLAWSAEL